MQDSQGTVIPEKAEMPPSTIVLSALSDISLQCSPAYHGGELVLNAQSGTLPRGRRSCMPGMWLGSSELLRSLRDSDAVDAHYERLSYWGQDLTSDTSVWGTTAGMRQVWSKCW